MSFTPTKKKSEVMRLLLDNLYDSLVERELKLEFWKLRHAQADDRKKKDEILLKVGSAKIEVEEHNNYIEFLTKQLEKCLQEEAFQA